MKSHALGCSCARHATRPWNRPEHWTKAEVQELERYYGLMADATLARRIGRTVVGVKLKAKRLGIRKRDQGWSAYQVAEIFGVDATTVGKVWIRRGLMHAHAPNRPNLTNGHRTLSIGQVAEIRTRRAAGESREVLAVVFGISTMQVYRIVANKAWTQRPTTPRPPRWYIAETEVDRFIAEHPEWVDVGKMPDSPFRDVAARDPWISLPEIFLRTGKDYHRISLRIRAGEIEGRKRGSHWFIPEREIGKIRPLAPDHVDEANFRRQSRLEHRRNRRKLAAA